MFLLLQLRGSHAGCMAGGAAPAAEEKTEFNVVIERLWRKQSGSH